MGEKPNATDEEAQKHWLASNFREGAPSQTEAEARTNWTAVPDEGGELAAPEGAAGGSDPAEATNLNSSRSN